MCVSDMPEERESEDVGAALSPSFVHTAESQYSVFIHLYYRSLFVYMGLFDRSLLSLCLPRNHSRQETNHRQSTMSLCLPRCLFSLCPFVSAAESQSTRDKAPTVYCVFVSAAVSFIFVFAAESQSRRLITDSSFDVQRWIASERA